MRHYGKIMVDIELKPGFNVEEGNERRHSVAKFVNDYDSYNEYDTGLRMGWVYSVSEDGVKSWHGVGPDGERSETSDANATDRNCRNRGR